MIQATTTLTFTARNQAASSDAMAQCRSTIDTTPLFPRVRKAAHTGTPRARRENSRVMFFCAVLDADAYTASLFMALDKASASLQMAIAQSYGVLSHL